MSSRFTACILICRVPASWFTVLINISLIGPKGHVGYEPGSCEMARRASHPGLEITANRPAIGRQLPSVLKVAEQTLKVEHGGELRANALEPLK
jgi:hypothetical protein